VYCNTSWSVSLQLLWSLVTAITAIIINVVVTAVTVLSCNLERNGTEYTTGMHVSDPCTLTILDPLCSPYVHVSSSHTPSAKCIVLLIEMSSKSSGFLEGRPRCLDLTVVNASHSQRMRKAISDACLYLSHLGLFTSPNVHRCPLDYHVQLSILSLSLAGSG
jgi:hypothetical protein